MRVVELKWTSHTHLTDARSMYRNTPCVYIQADKRGRPVRVGKASRGLEPRYHGGTGYALDAAAHSSGNLVFAARVKGNLCDAVERTLIWNYREMLTYNNMGKKTPPKRLLKLSHTGQPPRFPNGYHD